MNKPKYGWNSGEAAMHSVIHMVAKSLAEICNLSVEDVEADMHLRIKGAREEINNNITDV